MSSCLKTQFSTGTKQKHQLTSNEGGAQGLITEGKEGKRRLDRRMTEYDAARSKHLNLKSNPKVSKWRKGDDAEKIHSDMIAAQVIHLKQPSVPLSAACPSPTGPSPAGARLTILIAQHLHASICRVLDLPGSSMDMYPCYALITCTQGVPCCHNTLHSSRNVWYLRLRCLRSRF